MKVAVIRNRIRTTVNKWASQEKATRGKLRAKPEILLKFIPTSRRRPRVSTVVMLYHKPKGKEPKTEYSNN